MKVYVEPGARPPVRAHKHDAGIDLCAFLAAEQFEVKPHSYASIGTGVHVEVPIGYYGRICSRSGLNRDYGITADGVVDSDYNGEVAVILHNDGDKPFIVRNGDRIAQMIVQPYEPACVTIVSDYEFFDDDSKRGSNGFGSTGR